MKFPALAEKQDLQGNALNAQRFKMLSDIAEELQKRIVFPISFDLTIGIRNALQKGLPDEHLRQLLRLDPLICAKLLRDATRKARRHKQTAVTDIERAIAFLDGDTIVKVATEFSTAQLLRSRSLADYSEWACLQWERTLSMAATAHVIAKKHTDIAPEQAMFAALCHDLSLYYMLYRAVKYPELRARPASLKHLVINWHGGIAQSLLNSLALPSEIIEAVSGEMWQLTQKPKTLGDIVQISKILLDPPSESTSDSGYSTLEAHFRDDQSEIQAFRQVLYCLYS